MNKPPDYYALLGLVRSATQQEIRQAYLESAKRLHPDKNKLAGETEIFLDIQKAYETLYNPKNRKKYDSTLPPEERPDLPIEYNIHYSRPNLIRSDDPQRVYVLLEISPRKNAAEIPAPPLNICLVLDRSTSMKGEKMDVLKNAAIKVMQSLRPQDIFSVVSFSDRAEVVIPATSPYNNKQLEARIQMLLPSGATEIFQGLQAGFNEIKRNSDQNHIDHIILMTDGHTYGDEDKCVQLAEKAAKQGIGLSAMGISMEWNDIFLDTLAKRTGGSSRYIARTEDIENFLVEKFDTLSHTLADDVTLSFKEIPGVELAYAFRTQPETGPLPIENLIHLGPVLQYSTLSVLLEYKVDASLTKKDEIILMQGSLKLSIAAMPTAIQPLNIEFSREIKEEAGSEAPSIIIIRALGKLTFYRMQERAHAEVKQGQFQLASKSMKQLATSLLSQGERSLARTALMEAENIENMQAFSDEGSKRIKYGTRALIQPTQEEHLK